MNSGQALSPVGLENRWVHFRIRDCYFPEPNVLLARLYGDHLLQGRVREVPTMRDQQFVVVDVDGISTPVIVALDQILGVL